MRNLKKRMRTRLQAMWSRKRRRVDDQEEVPEDTTIVSIYGALQKSKSTSLTCIQRSSNLRESGIIVHLIPPVIDESNLRKKFSGLSYILSQLSPVIIEKDSEEVLEGERGRLALRQHRAISNNVILESPCPEKSPHIVITPSPEQDHVEASGIAKHNRIPFQNQPLLSICPTISSEIPDQLFGSPWNRDTLTKRVVFNLSKFVQSVKRAERDRISGSRRFIIPAVTRHLLKVSVMSASISALSFRARYDSPGFLESLEDAYRWTDPALAFLSLYREHAIGVHHIPSPEPFSVPHILIEESFGNDGTVIDCNTAPPQDSAGKTSLLVLCTGPSMSFSSLDTKDAICDTEDYSTSTITLGRATDDDFFWSSEVDVPSDAALSLEAKYLPTTSTIRSSKARFFIEEDSDDESC